MNLPWISLDRERRSELALVLIALILYLLFLAYLTFGLGFQMLSSDVSIYWKESLKWATPFSKWWVPGYPLTIALVRALTLNMLPQLAVMLLISGMFFLVSVATVSKLAQELKLKYPMKVGLLYAVFPFVGLTYGVYPIADSMALALLLLSLLAFNRQRWLALAGYASFAMMTHKAMWFFIPPLLLIAFIGHKKSRLLLPLAFVPLAVLLIAGAIYHHDVFWMVRWGMDNLLVSKSSLPIFDGIVGSLLSGSVPKILKGSVALAIFIASITVLYLSWRHKFYIGLPISLALVLMAASINQYEVWAVVRFGKALVIPIAYFLLMQTGRLKLPDLLVRLAFPLLFLAGIFSNILFGYYMVKVWTA